ncbi:MAG: hypothetical protein NVSMB14_03610 [Isosphaeraceae bacterium]
MSEEHEHNHDPHHHDDEGETLEFDARTQIFLELRRQNLDLLDLAARVAGFAGEHPPLKGGGDVEHAVKRIWDVYSEFYSWIDPEEDQEDDDEEEEEE